MINGPNLWLFWSDGLKVYSPDGNEELKSTPPEDICHNVTGYSDGFVLSCSFYDVASNGGKYVWATLSRGVTKIDVLDIDSGTTVDSFEHAIRQEILSSILYVIKSGSDIWLHIPMTILEGTWMCFRNLLPLHIQILLLT